MGVQNSVMILGGSLDIGSSLKADLEALGFQPLEGKYPDVDPDDIAGTRMDAVLLDFTICNNDALSACEHLLHENILPAETALIALVSDNTMGQIPLDYKITDIIKFPYDIAELDFRLRRAIYLYHQEYITDTIRIGDLSISPSMYEVKAGGRPVVLSHKEYELFKYLITNPNRVFTREDLLSGIWGYDKLSDSRTVDVHIRRVRVKIGDFDQTYIKTIRGVGYTFRFEEGS